MVVRALAQSFQRKIALSGNFTCVTQRCCPPERGTSTVIHFKSRSRFHGGLWTAVMVCHAVCLWCHSCNNGCSFLTSPQTAFLGARRREEQISMYYYGVVLTLVSHVSSTFHYCRRSLTASRNSPVTPRGQTAAFEKSTRVACHSCNFHLTLDASLA